MNKLNKNLHKAITISSSLMGSIFFFGGIGYLLSQKLNNSNWFIILLILGALIGLYESYKQITK